MANKKVYGPGRTPAIQAALRGLTNDSVQFALAIVGSDPRLDPGAVVGRFVGRIIKLAMAVDDGVGEIAEAVGKVAESFEQRIKALEARRR